MGKIYVVGLGPGDESMMTAQAKAALEDSDIIVGYKAYTELIKEQYAHKEIIDSAMRQEIDRCGKCLELAKEGKKVALICSGDAGVYGMASPMLEVADEDSVEIEIVPGISAAMSGAAVLGAPLNHDICIISLSDLLTPWELIEKRLKLAVQGDFCIALYNPSSHKRADYLKKACDIMLTETKPDICCGFVKNIGREGTSYELCTLEELRDKEVDMFTTVFIGNSQTKVVNGKMVTPRGYIS